MQVKALWVYPVKSMAGSSVQEAELQGRGFKNDRRWMLVDEDGRFISQREHSLLTRWQATVSGNDLLFKHLSTQKNIEIKGAKTNLGDLVDVEVWGTHFKTRLVNMPNLAHFQETIGIASCRLVYMADDTQRKLDPKHSKEGEEVSFADGYPYLIANTASLQTLNERLDEQLDMRRFRPNIVIESDTPFSEDNWTSVTIGDHFFRTPKPCARCIMITIDPETTEKKPEVMAELASFRKVGRKILFGINAVWEGEKGEQPTLRVGDKLID